MSRAKIENSPLTLETVADALRVAQMSGDKAAAEEFKVTTQTIRRWRTAFKTRDKVYEFVTLHRKALSEQCHKKASDALMATADFIVSCATGADRSPEMLRAVTDAARTMSQYLTLDRAIEARISGIDVFGDGSPKSLPQPHTVDAADFSIEDSAKD